MGILLGLRGKDAPPAELGSPMEAMERFQRRSTECLLRSGYSTTPGPYTIEALLLNLQVEFVRRREAQLGVWVMGGVALRIAMRMGYHRDPSGYPEFSVYQGEMRRRIWAVMVQLDALTSYQIGCKFINESAVCFNATILRNIDILTPFNSTSDDPRYAVRYQAATEPV